MDPLIILLVSALSTVLISALCSLSEAAVYSVPLPYVRALADEGSAAAEVLNQLKSDIGKPIAAILILNTTANTGGASIAGWAAAQVLSGYWAVVFSIGFILTILYLSEILPKTVGVHFCRPVSLFAAWPIYFLVKALAPLIYLSHGFSKLIGAGDEQRLVSEEEVKAMATLGAAEGTLEHLEGSVIANVLQLDQLLVRDVLTPRVVVFRINENTTFSEIKDEISGWNYSRVPLYADDTPDDLKSYVTQRDLFREIIAGADLNEPIKRLARPLETVPELLRVDKLLLRMFENKEHICAVVDEHGSLAGIVTLEDIIEEIVGREIVDEYDTVTDLRTFARVLNYMKIRKRRNQ